MRFYINYHPIESDFSDDDPLYLVEVWEADSGVVVWWRQAYEGEANRARQEAAQWVREQELKLQREIAERAS